MQQPVMRTKASEVCILGTEINAPVRLPVVTSLELAFQVILLWLLMQHASFVAYCPIFL